MHGNHIYSQVFQLQTSKMEPSQILFGGTTTAWELLQLERRPRIATFCNDLDAILGGGVRTQEVTEVCGVPGIGKTQVGIQLAINVQVPAAFGGLNGQAVYIDSEGSFVLDRALQMAEGCIQHLRTRDVAAATAVHLVAEDFLDGIYYYRVCDSIEQQAVLHNLRTFLTLHRKVKIVVIDSLTFHFRQDYDDMSARARILSQIALDLMQLAQEHDIAIVLVNQVLNYVTAESSRLVPALGEGWTHSCTNRIMLYWKEGCRYAHLYKSPSLPSATAAYEIRGHGIRDLPDRSTKTSPPVGTSV